MASAKGADSTKSTTFGLLWCSLHFGGPRNRKCRNPQGPSKLLPEKERTLQNRKLLGFCGVPSISTVPEAGNAGNLQGLGNGFYKIDNFWAFVGFSPFRRSEKPEMQEIHMALEIASGKGADSTKSTTFGLLWGSLHFGGPRSRKCRKSTGPWKWLPKKERALQNRQLLGFCGVPSISAVPETGNAGNPQGPWKWLPEKERTLQNRQLLGFCGVLSISAVPETGNAGNPRGPWKWLPEKERADSTKSTTFVLLWGSLHFGGPRNGFRKRSGLYKIDNFWAFVVFPPFRRSQKPEMQEIHRGRGNGFHKRSGLYKIENCWAFVEFPQFQRFQKPEIHRGLGKGFRKRSGLYKIDNFWAFVGFPPFRRSQSPPNNRKSEKN